MQNLAPPAQAWTALSDIGAIPGRVGVVPSTARHSTLSVQNAARYIRERSSRFPRQAPHAPHRLGLLHAIPLNQHPLRVLDVLLVFEVAPQHFSLELLG